MRSDADPTGSNYVLDTIKIQIVLEKSQPFVASVASAINSDRRILVRAGPGRSVWIDRPRGPITVQDQYAAVAVADHHSEGKA